ncbi:ThiF family adenylyltransferase [Massilia yuzhufengensis]|uniref:ThiF family protein n=1 Tax=Massilia yuzhufengensis TaxID=1164594 RepID=A0A1I1IUL0_9BURK|nr:ThiF family adenylyltransferase [Massilia yuzhufengensis]SFC39934.1 ThiF family protein [Massilia yuzhufengensis]
MPDSIGAAASPLESHLLKHPLIAGVAEDANQRRQRRFALVLPPMPEERAFSNAWLVLPGKFPEERARIQLSRDAILRVPHVDSSGDLCFSGEAGPASGATAEARLDRLLALFQEEFLVPWLTGKLDCDFEKETANYWTIHVNRYASDVDAVKRVYTLDVRPTEPRLLDGQLLQPSRTLIVGDNLPLASRLIASLGPRATQVATVIVADIPVDFPFTPRTWPAQLTDILSLLQSRLNDVQYRAFERASHARATHRLVLLRAPTCTYGYLLPGGPPTVVVKGKTKRAYPTGQLLPLLVERVDPGWTCGRDQHAQVGARQRSHVLVLGAGALGSVVIDTLARSGVGRITVVDPDFLSASNIGRHLLGADMLGLPKAQGIAAHVGRAVPSCQLDYSREDAEAWLMRATLSGVDIVLDITGEPDVRAALETARLLHPRPLVISWMEPYVAAAHVCVLKDTEHWLAGLPDRLIDLQAVDWPDDVIMQEPGCSSQFQSYTPAQATFAVALVAEAALALIDRQVAASHLRSWVRGQSFLDAHYPGLVLREWAHSATKLDGVLLCRPWP